MSKMYWIQNVLGNPGVFCPISDQLAAAISDFERKRYRLHPEISGVQNSVVLTANPSHHYEQKKLNEILDQGHLQDLLAFCKQMSHTQAATELEFFVKS